MARTHLPPCMSLASKNIVQLQTNLEPGISEEVSFTVQRLPLKQNQIINLENDHHPISITDLLQSIGKSNVPYQLSQKQPSVTHFTFMSISQ